MLYKIVDNVRINCVTEPTPFHSIFCSTFPANSLFIFCPKIMKNYKDTSEEQLRRGLDLFLDAADEAAEDLELTTEMAGKYFTMLKNHCKLLRKMEDVRDA